MMNEAKLVVDKGVGIAAPGADTDWLAADIAPSANCMAWRATVVVATGRVVRWVDDTGTVIGVNSGVALVANQAYVFDLPTSILRTYNLQATGGDTAIDYLLVHEVPVDRL